MRRPGALRPPADLHLETCAAEASLAWGWVESALPDAGAGLRHLVLSAYTGKHSLLVHTGLLNPGDQPEFVFVLGSVEPGTGGWNTGSSSTGSPPGSGGVESQPAPLFLSRVQGSPREILPVVLTAVSASRWEAPGGATNPRGGALRVR